MKQNDSFIIIIQKDKHMGLDTDTEKPMDRSTIRSNSGEEQQKSKKWICGLDRNHKMDTYDNEINLREHCSREKSVPLIVQFGTVRIDGRILSLIFVVFLLVVWTSSNVRTCNRIEIKTSFEQYSTVRIWFVYCAFTNKN